MSTPGPNLVKWYPPVDDNPSPAQTALHFRLLYNGTNDHDQAITTLKSQVSALDASVKSVTNTTTNTGRTITITDIAGFGNLASVNNQTGSTAYTVQSGDNGSLIALSDASPIAVTLNSVVLPPYFVFFANQGLGLVTMTASSGVINGASTIPGKTSAIVFFDGTNWWTWAILTPLSLAAATHQWLKSYDATTGLFTQTQPAYSDISGTPVLPVTIAPVANEFLTGYNATTGTFTQALAVISFNGRTGAVVPTTADYTAAQVTNAFDLSNTGTQTALGNLTVTSGKTLAVNNLTDTTGAVTIALLTTGVAFNTFLRANGGITCAHYFASGLAPTFAVQAGAGTGATASVAAASDTCGVLTLNTQATGGAAGAWIKVTFRSAYGIAPKVFLTNATSVVTGATHYVNSTTTDFTILSTVAPTTTTVVWNYWVVG